MSNRLGGFISGQNINASIGTFTAVTSPTFTFGSSDGTPPVGQAVQLTTTGTLPTGLSLNTTYYVISVSTNTCQLSTTLGGSAVTFTNSSGSGTHTAVTQRVFNFYGGAPDTVEYLVVAGGGGGGGPFGGSYIGNGGGGAGGLLTGTGFSVVPATALIVTVGAGGAGGAVDTAGSRGANSIFSTITTVGGGGGGASGAGQNGGSGGGAGGNAIGAAPGIAVSGQGHSGAAGQDQGGGGGGAGSPGIRAINSSNAHGGTGLCSTITGQRVFYAGGGGGAVYADGTLRGYGIGGAGGGGDGFVYGQNRPHQATPGKANTGGGGGGTAGDFSATGYPSVAGGSGVVIIRYPQINSAPAMVTGSPQISYSDGYQIYTWTSSGSIIF